MKKGSPRRDMFAKEFVVDFNATAAAKRCGYSKKTAYSQGQRLLKNVEVQEAIRKLTEKRKERLEITANDWLAELKLIGFADLADYLDIDPDTGAARAKSFSEMPEGASRAIESIQEDRIIREDARGRDSVVNSKIKFKMHPKIEALKLIGQHLGFLKDQPVQLPQNLTVIIERRKPAEKPRD